MTKKPVHLPHSNSISKTQGFLTLSASILIFLSLLSFTLGKNWLGLLGHYVGLNFFYLLGLSSFYVPLFFGWTGFRKLLRRSISRYKIKLCFFCLATLSCSILLAQIGQTFPKFAAAFGKSVYTKSSFHFLGGVPLHNVYSVCPWNLHRFLGGLGTFLIAAILFGLSTTLLLNLPLISFATASRRFLSSFMSSKKSKESKPAKARSLPFTGQQLSTPEEEPASPPIFENVIKKNIHVKVSPPANLTEKKTPIKLASGYTLPPTSLLTQVKPVDQSSLQNDLRQQADVLQETLRSFGIEATVGEIFCGPTITLFEVHPSVGVKVQKIKTLEDDIALNMQAKSIRIIAPIPGKAAVGIEVPNPRPQEVSFRELLENYQSTQRKLIIPLLLGKVVNGDPIWADLTRMPHLIIAGATGSGKSVCINTIVMSILTNAHPDEIKLLMIDPKKVELTSYSQLPHMLAPVITESGIACAALGWLVKEMERRYEMFRQLGIRNIVGFNSRKPNPELEKSLDFEVPETLFYIVVIIDELADLMMMSSSDIETPIARIAQMARAVGIHLILATQRPSREVITGLIKANFPTRIAFKVSSRVNSQIIIDENGAESLLGNGDMLFMPPGTSSLVRAQGGFIRDEDINKVIQFICDQVPPQYQIPSFEAYQSSDDIKEDFSNRDSLYEDAKSLILETGNASTTFLQRKLKIGYARAASLMDLLESGGIIGPQEGAKPRKIFYPANSILGKEDADRDNERELDIDEE